MEPYRIHIKDFTGEFCGDGDKASLIKITKIDPALDKENNVIFDFTGTRSMNSSFSNALIGNLVAQRGVGVLNHLFFHGCNQKMRVLIEIAVELGLKRNEQIDQKTA